MTYSNPNFQGSSQAVNSPNINLQYLWDQNLNNSQGQWRPVGAADLSSRALSNDEALVADIASFNGNADIDNSSENYSLRYYTVGTVGNKTITGDGISTMSSLASANGLAVLSGNGALVPDNGASFSLTGGVDPLIASLTVNGITYQYHTVGSIGNTFSIEVVNGISLGHTLAANIFSFTIVAGVTTRQDLVNYITGNVPAINASCSSCGSLATTPVATPLSGGTNGAYAGFSGLVPVESKYEGVVITADLGGSSGNVTITGNDIDNISQLVSAHNATPGNAQLTVSSGGSFILNNGATIILTGGNDSESTPQELYDPNFNFYYTKHSYVLKFVGTGTSASANISYLVKNDGIDEFASIKEDTISWNPSVDGAVQLVAFHDEFNYSSAKVLVALTNATAFIAETHTA